MRTPLTDTARHRRFGEVVLPHLDDAYSLARWLTGNGTDAYKYGVASSLSQSATTILDQFINIPPTITIREGHRVKVYISQDLLLPAYENHTIPSTL